MKKRKVIQLVWSLNDGGAETLVKNYALMLQKDNVEVVVVTIVPKHETANFKELRKNNIKIISVFRKWNLFSKICFNLIENKYITYVLKRIIKRENPDAIHAHLSVEKYLDVISKDLRGIKLFYTCHTVPKRIFTGPIGEKKVQALKNLIKNNNLQMIALHGQMKNELNELFAIDNTIVLRNGIDFTKFKDIKVKKNILKEELSIPQDAFIIGTIGRLEKVKNHDFLIDIFICLKRLKENAFLLIIGDGELKSHTQNRLINEGLKDCSLILSNRNDIPKLLKIMDVFVFPSIQEGLGISFIEAQISGLKCIVSEAIPKEAFISKKSICLNLNEDISVWVDKILEENTYKENNEILNEDDYDLNNIIKQIERLYF